MSFCTVVNCMDGRVQLPVNEYLRERYGVEFVDTITEAGPVRMLACPVEEPTSAASIVNRVEVSVLEHGSELVAVAAHAECAGNPVAEAEQRRQINESARYLARRFPAATVVGLWVGEEWSVEHICVVEPAGT